MTDTRANVLEMVGVGRTYQEAVPVRALVDADLVIRQGEFVSVVGPSGSGKSTLLHLLGLLDRPTSGSYRFEGTDVVDFDDARRAAVRGQRIGFVFQAFHLMDNRAAVDNVLVSLLYNRTDRTDRRARANAALDRVGLAHRSSFRPTRLSGGEQQRVAIARALAARPAVLLCDEPTGNLDTATSRNLLDLFGDLNADGLTIVVATHDPQVADDAHRRIELADGRIIADVAS